MSPAYREGPNTCMHNLHNNYVIFKIDCDLAIVQITYHIYSFLFHGFLITSLHLSFGILNLPCSHYYIFFNLPLHMA